MSKNIGSEPLGRFYTGKKPKRRREWRGLKDTWYDYVRWLGYWKTLITFIIKPNNMKGFFRYRWMINDLASIPLPIRLPSHVVLHCTAQQPISGKSSASATPSSAAGIGQTSDGTPYWCVTST